MKKIIYILSVVLLTACGQSKTQEGGQRVDEASSDTLLITKSQFETMRMEIDSIRKNPFEKVIPVSGRIDVPPQHRAVVSSLVDGYVSNIYVQEGESVRVGQLLLTLESPEYIQLQKDYLEVNSQLAYLASEYERQRSLYEENIVSKKKYLEAESKYKVAKASYTSSRQLIIQLKGDINALERGAINPKLSIYAAINGDVTQVQVSRGIPVNKADLLMEIVNPTQKVLMLSVYEKDVFNVADQQDISFLASQVENKVYAATIQKIGKVLTGQERTISVQAHLDPASQKELMVGMNVQANIKTQRMEYLSIPTDALIEEEGGTFMLRYVGTVNKGYQFVMTPVEVGHRMEHLIEIQSNEYLSEGTLFLSKGVYDVIN